MNLRNFKLLKNTDLELPKPKATSFSTLLKTNLPLTQDEYEECHQLEQTLEQE